MYSIPHAATGLLITTTVYALTQNETLAFAIGIPLAVFSHYFLDFLFEKGMSKNEVLIFEGIPTIIYVVLAICSGHFWLMICSLIAGNFLDWIDKKLYLTVFFPKKFKPTFYFHKHKKGIKFTLNQTKLAGIISTIVIIGMFLILIKI
jgi:hypothetical protein